MITYDPFDFYLENTFTYEELRFKLLYKTEGVREGVYYDTNGIAHNGIGFNIQEDASVLENVLKHGMGLFLDFVDLSAINITAEQKNTILQIEIEYRNKIETAMNATYSSSTALQKALDDIMSERFLDPRYDSVIDGFASLYFTKSEFRFSSGDTGLSEMRIVLDNTAKIKEDLVKRIKGSE